MFEVTIKDNNDWEVFKSLISLKFRYHFEKIKFYKDNTITFLTVEPEQLIIELAPKVLILQVRCINESDQN